jgi:hypothetical protein
MARYVNSSSLEVVGVKEALRTLNKMDKVARRQLTKDYAQIVSPVVKEARSLTPAKAPLSGMAYTWKGRGAKQTKPIFPYNAGATDRGIKPFVSGKKPRQFGGFVSNLATFGVRWNSSDAIVIEMSGKGPVPTAKGKQMVRDLSQRYGEPGRFLWKAYLKHEAEVVRNVEVLIKDLMRRVQRDI